MLLLAYKQLWSQDFFIQSGECIYTAEPLAPEPSLVEVEIDNGKLKSYKSPGADHILAEMNKEGGKTLCSEIHRLIHPI
jgi:hypothetical protein